MSEGAERRAVVVMAKRPQAGNTKTRLAPALSLDQAAALYERFLFDTVEAIRRRDDCTLVIAIDRPNAAQYFSTMAPDAEQVQQVGTTLGERLDAVMTACFARGFEEVFAIGSDSPDLPAGHLTQAFSSLATDEVDVVLGPTEDGGYYLIGWKQPWPDLVTKVEMSTPSVLADTLAVADEIGARISLAPSWYDVDEADDLQRLRESLIDRTASHTAAFLASLGPTP